MAKWRNNKPGILGLADGSTVNPTEVFEADEANIPQAWRDQKWVVPEGDTQTKPLQGANDGPQPVVTESAPVRARIPPSDPSLEEVEAQQKPASPSPSLFNNDDKRKR